MKIKEKIQKLFGINNPKRIAEGIAQIYTENKENGEEHPIDNTVDKIMDIINESKDPEVIRELLKNVLDDKQIPDRIFEKTATKISEDEKIPSTIIAEAVQQSKTNVPDQVIVNIVEKAEENMNTNERLQLIKNVDDKKLIEEHIKNELIILYKSCKYKKDNEVTEKVEEITKILEGQIDEEISELVQKVVAKKMAENYYSDVSKGTKIYTLSKVIPVTDMIDADLPSKVEKEYAKIEREEGKKEGRFDKSQLKIMILREMARNIAKQYEETRTFIIPQSKNMRNLDKHEEQEFINSIEVFFGQELSQQEIANIEGQIRGTRGNMEELIKQIRKIPDEDKMNSINVLTELLKDKETIRTLSIFKDNKIMEKFNSIPLEKREKTIQLIGDTLERTKYKVERDMPKIKDVKINKKTEETER